MYKSLFVLLLISLFLVSFSISFADTPKIQKLTRIDDGKYIYQEDLIRHRLSVVTTEAGQTQVIDTLSWYDPLNINAAMPYTFPNDTVFCDFKLIPDPAYLLKVRGIYGTGGLADFYVTDGVYTATGGVATGFGPTVYDNRQWNVAGNPAGVLNFEELDFTPAGPDTIFLPWSPDPNPADRPHFVIGYVCSGTGVNQGDGIPDIYYDYNETYVPGGPRGHSWFTYSGAGYYGIRYSGNQAWAQYVFEVVVNYYNGTSPFVNSVTQLNDTWATSGFSPVVAELVDIDGTITQSYMYYQKNADPVDSVMATSSTGDMYYFDIPGTYVPGDSISYWIGVTDNDNKSVLGAKQYFKVLEPQNPTAPILVVFNGLIADEADITLFWQPLLDAVIVDSLGLIYEWWDVETHRGIDGSIINYTSFEHALVVGFSVNQVPVESYAGTPWETFVNAGKNLLVASSDYLFSQGYGGSLTFEAGDFINDVFGVGAAVSDPDDGSGNSAGDEFVIGIAGDPVSDMWSQSPLVFNFYALLGDNNWNDYAEADPAKTDAATVFTGVVSGEGNGVRNLTASNGKAIYLTFNLSALADTNATGEPVIQEDAYKLLKEILDWFNMPLSIDDNPSVAVYDYSLEANYPNPFNPTTTIEYSLKTQSRVSLVIYNTLGEKVRSLVSDLQPANQYKVVWDGRNDHGMEVSSGIYIYRITAGDFVSSKKMIFMK
ncbi:MAG: T9SS C-terminal target domain-containing protein [Calditrichaeota bacterium]|nr:T9SS type A sorting domain-containing protein [Calditrichota bacterium]RQW01850.1 MAG: T9SS C-terminal target domain-containing protein [Calditrichota bacterium]